MEHKDEFGSEGPLTPATVGNEWSPPPSPALPEPSSPLFQWENPHWGFLIAMLVWVASVVLLLLMSFLFAIPFFVQVASAGNPSQDAMQLLINDPKFLVWQVAATIPAHALTLFLIWVLVTRARKRPFWSSINWGWGDYRNLIAIGGGVAAAMFLLWLSVLLKNKIGGGETMIDRLIESSRAARYLLAFLAAVSAPLVEELIYRGVLYPAAQRGIARLGRQLLPDPRHHDSIQIYGAIIAVLFVSALFSGVHVSQYSNSMGVIAAISMLSLVLTGSRAVTGRVLPGFAIHFAFNGIQAIGLLTMSDVEKKIVPPAPTAAALTSLLQHLPFFN